MPEPQLRGRVRHLPLDMRFLEKPQLCRGRRRERSVEVTSRSVVELNVLTTKGLQKCRDAHFLVHLKVSRGSTHSTRGSLGSGRARPTDSHSMHPQQRQSREEPFQATCHPLTTWAYRRLAGGHCGCIKWVPDHGLSMRRRLYGPDLEPDSVLTPSSLPPYGQRQRSRLWTATSVCLMFSGFRLW